MYHILIHSSVGGHLGYFHVLTVVGGAAMSTGVHMSFGIILSLGMCPGVGFLGHMIALLFFLRKFHTVFHSGISIGIPTKVEEGTFFPIPFPAFNICRFFNDDHSDECEVILHCNFVLHFSNNLLNSFHTLLAIYMSSLEKCVIRFYAHLVFFFFLVYFFLTH